MDTMLYENKDIMVNIFSSRETFQMLGREILMLGIVAPDIKWVRQCIRMFKMVSVANIQN